MPDMDKDPVRYAAEVIGQDPFARLLGIQILEARDSFARASLAIKDEYCNALVRTHGGVVFSLADQTCAVAVHATGIKAIALEMKINYLKTTRPGDVIVAEASPMDIRTRVSLWNVEVTTESGEKVAVAQALAYHIL